MPGLTPYQRFDRCYQQAVSLLPNSRNFLPASEDAHKTRYAIILGVASMDAYFTKKFIEKLTDQLKKGDISYHLIQLLKDAGVNENFYLSLLNKQRPYSRMANRVQRHLENLTTQKFHKIDELFKKYKVKKLSARSIEYARNNLHRLEHKTYRSRIIWLVDRRNVIAHSCDFNLHNRFDKIEVNTVKNFLNTMQYFVKGADHVLNEEL